MSYYGVQVSFFYYPNTFIDYNWENIKKFFMEFQKEVQNRLEK